MAMSNSASRSASATPGPVVGYRAPAKAFHWITLAFILVMVPVGVIMSDRGERNIWDALTNTMYSSHKLAGFILLWIIVARLGYRLVVGAPPDEPTLAPIQKIVSHATHWALYGLLIAIPVTGWLGVSMFPALDIFGLFSLPSIAATDADMAKRVLNLHGWLVQAFLVLGALHVGAALFHHFVRKDNVLRRMMPQRR
jgi:cytochrome b561